MSVRVELGKCAVRCVNRRRHSTPPPSNLVGIDDDWDVLVLDSERISHGLHPRIATVGVNIHLPDLLFVGTVDGVVAVDDIGKPSLRPVNHLLAVIRAFEIAHYFVVYVGAHPNVEGGVDCFFDESNCVGALTRQAVKSRY